VSAQPPAHFTIADFIEKALASGIPHDSLVGLLTARGWPEKEVYEALADHYQRLTGVQIPAHAGAGAAAKEAFFYLLVFSTLATWTIGFGYLAFALIDHWFADTLFSGYQQVFETYTMTRSMAALIVAFPLFVLISRAVIREAAEHPQKLESGVRKWLTYMALVIAAGVFMGDLIAVLASLLRGEITSRFLCKSLVVLVLSGGVFYYYFGGLRRTEASPAAFNRDRFMAVISSVAVILLVIAGFLNLGAPKAQREIRADNQRVRQLFSLSNDIRNYWVAHRELPAGTDQIPGGSYADPVTNAPYEYHPKQGSQYELCAVFMHKNADQQTDSGPDAWAHPAGHHCFSLDAAIPMQYPGQLYP
jgi:hypothetical protein